MLAKNTSTRKKKTPPPEEQILNEVVKATANKDKDAEKDYYHDSHSNENEFDEDDPKPIVYGKKDDDEFDDDEFEEDDLDETSLKQSSKEKPDNKNPSLKEKFLALPLWLKIVLGITLVALIQMGLEMKKGSTGDQTIEQAPEVAITKESVKAEDNVTNTEEKLKTLNSCLIATPISVMPSVTGNIISFGSQNISNGEVFCDEFQAGAAQAVQAAGDFVFNVDISSKGQKITTKSVSFLDSLRAEYYIEGIELNDPKNIATRKTISVGDELTPGIVLTSIVQSPDGTTVSYVFKNNSQEIRKTVSRSIVL